MVEFTKENGMMINCMEEEKMSGLMGKYMKVNGMTITRMDVVN